MAIESARDDLVVEGRQIRLFLWHTKINELLRFNKEMCYCSEDSICEMGIIIVIERRLE